MTPFAVAGGLALGLVIGIISDMIGLRRRLSDPSSK